MNNEKFKRGELSTHFIDEEFSQGLKVKLEDDALKMVALFTALAEYQNNQSRIKVQKLKSSKAQGENPWKMEGRRRGLRRFGM
jgi:hypothetical protein